MTHRQQLKQHDPIKHWSYASSLDQHVYESIGNNNGPDLIQPQQQPFYIPYSSLSKPDLLYASNLNIQVSNNNNHPLNNPNESLYFHHHHLHHHLPTTLNSINTLNTLHHPSSVPHLPSNSGSSNQSTSLSRRIAPHSSIGNHVKFNNLKSLRKWATNVYSRYQALIRSILLLILIAFGCITIVRYLMPTTSNSFINTSNPQQISRTSFNSQQQQSINVKTAAFQYNQQQQQSESQSDLLKSRILTGEFVLMSQNYSHSSAQRSLLADRLAALLNQVFLATDVRRYYSHTKVTNIRLVFAALPLTNLVEPTLVILLN